jgi:hypothetical protein
MTGGRTRSRYELAIEALVFTTPVGEERLPELAHEQQTIAAICRSVRSVAEIAAGLRVPLGVARVLVGDMADEGLVRVHQQPDRDQAPDLALLERVLSGLRKL